MQLAISNIAWSKRADDTIASSLIAAGGEALEVAPSRLWVDPAGVTQSEANAVKATWADRGLPIVSMQSVLYGEPAAALFKSEGGLRAILARLEAEIKLAGALGCGPIVFGSPLNRLKGPLDFHEAVRRAVPVFRQIGDLAANADCVLCIEPNAPDYGCDFVTRLSEASELVHAVGHPSVGLVVDTGNMEMVGDEIVDLRTVHHSVRHLHISRVRLRPVDEAAIFARRVVEMMLDVGFRGIATIEMRQSDSDLQDLGAVCHALETVRRWRDG